METFLLLFNPRRLIQSLGSAWAPPLPLFPRSTLALPVFNFVKALSVLLIVTASPLRLQSPILPLGTPLQAALPLNTPSLLPFPAHPRRPPILPLTSLPLPDPSAAGASLLPSLSAAPPPPIAARQRHPTICPPLRYLCPRPHHPYVLLLSRPLVPHACGDCYPPGAGASAGAVLISRPASSISDDLIFLSRCASPSPALVFIYPLLVSLTWSPLPSPALIRPVSFPRSPP